MRLDRFLTLYLFHRLRRIIPRPNGIRIPILMYHSISGEPESSHPYFWINTSPKRFAGHMQFLHNNNYKVISLPDAVRIIKSATNHPITQSPYPPIKYVVLTFDDGFYDFFTHAWPILTEFGFTATMFLPTAFIANSRKSFKGRECLTWSEVRQLHNNYGISFGSHTVNHAKLYDLPWREIRQELCDSRLQLEDNLQAPVCSFAYPYAFPQEDRGFVEHFRKVLHDQGYCVAVTSVIGRMRPGGDPLYLKRLPVNGCDDERLLESKIGGAYDWMASAQKAVRRFKFSLDGNSDRES